MIYLDSFCFDELPEMSIVWVILGQVELIEVCGLGFGRWMGGFGPKILSLLVLIEIRIRIKTRM